MKILASLAIILSISASWTQSPTQTIRGKVVDSETRITLVGVLVEILNDSTGTFKTTCDVDGNFVFKNVPVGRHTLGFQLASYRSTQRDVVIISGKELVLTVEMEESAEEMKTFVIEGNARGEAGNEMAVISARRFSVDETNRYAGSRGDPARMASNYAGVQGADDSRNDIVVRGNSPLGVLWRVEGIDIPNPNHFAVAGSQGGPVTILNNKVLANSDFFTSAFPAEFGNSVSAVFDIKLRNGNSTKHEFSGQLGFLGTEITAEGPISKSSGSSYLINYRYSTLTLFSALGINIGTDAVPRYQDGSFKLNFPLANNAMISFFGLGGKSDIDILISEQTEPSTDLYAENDRDQIFGTRMGVIGTKFTKSINNNNYLSLTVAATGEQQAADHNYVVRHLTPENTYVLDSVYDLLDYRFRQSKITTATNMTTKLSRRHILKYGLNADFIRFNHQDSVLNFAHTERVVRWDTVGNTYYIQPYIQWKIKATDRLTLTSGWHLSYFALSNSLSAVEPRVGVKYTMQNNQSISFGAGVHSQIQPFYTYMYHLTDANEKRDYHNIDMDMTKSIHLAGGYNKGFKNNMRVKTEVYYQHLYDVPVEIRPSSFSLVNQGSGFSRFFPDSLSNEGTARNYGLELTVEKFFDNDFFFLVTSSLYESTYVGSDGIRRSTDYNGNFIVNGLIGKEYKINKKNVLAIGGKVTWAGGQRFGLVDTTASRVQNELIYLDQDYNDFQFNDYFRLDLKINYTINGKKVSHEIALDLVNITGQQNVLGLTYTPGRPDGQDFRQNYQLGFLPIFYYRVDF